MMNKKINIITLGDIFENIETEENAFKFLDYIRNLQQQNIKYKEVLDKIKDKCLENMYIDDRGEEVESIERDIKPSDILELLEEIE